jgi:hypothetical protein
MRYQQFTYHAYSRAAEPVSKMALQQEKAFCVLHFEVSRSVITVQREFRALFKKYIIIVGCVFLKICMKLTLLHRHPGNWSRGPTVSIRSELLVVHEKLGQHVPPQFLTACFPVTSPGFCLVLGVYIGVVI